MAAILRYNNSVAYARNVLGWAAAYATGVVPVDLPPITGPVPPIGDMHLDNYQGLGPGLPINALGLPADDPLALMPLTGPQRRRQPDPRLSRPEPRTAAGPAAALSFRSSRSPQQPAPAAVAAAVDAAASAGAAQAAGCAVFCITPTAPAPSALPLPHRATAAAC